MASSLSRDDRIAATVDLRTPLRVSSHTVRPASKRDAVLLGTASFYGDSVYDVAGEFIGEMQELVLDIHSGRIAYALIAVGGFLGLGRKICAVPWSTVTLDRVYQRCIIDIGLERLIDAPGLDGDLLPRMADPDWAAKVHAYFGCRPYWE